MRILRETTYHYSLPSEVFAVLRSSTTGEPLSPNLRSLNLWTRIVASIPLIRSLLSPRTTDIRINFGCRFPPRTVPVALVITTFPALCPNLQRIRLDSLPRDPMITAAVSKLLLTPNRDALQQFRVESPLTEEARKVVYKLPNLCGLLVVGEGSAPLPTMVLPNLTKLVIVYNHDCDWLEGLRGATLGRLKSVTFRVRSESARIADFLEVFASVGLTISTTLSTFRFYTFHSWRASYRPLLLFKQLRKLEITFSCEGGCSSTIDDDTITDMARAMPKLEYLELGEPCGVPAGVTAEGLTVLANHCLHLSGLRIHFRVDSFHALPMIADTPRVGTAAPRKECDLDFLGIGDIPLPEESMLVVTKTLVRIFPNLSTLDSADKNWKKVSDAIRFFRISGHSGKKPLFTPPRDNLSYTSPRTTLESGS